MGTGTIVASVVAFFGLFGLLFVMLGASGGGGNGVEVCDVSGTLGGLVRDYNELTHDVINWNLNTATVANSCHIKQFWEFSLTSAPFNSGIPAGALYTPGSVTIYVKLFDGSDQVVREKSFTVTTGIGETQKTFNESLFFDNIPHGQYKVKVFHSWTGNQIDFEQGVTV